MDIVFLFCVLTFGQGAFLFIYLINSNQTNRRSSYILAAIILIELLTLYDEVFLFYDNSHLPMLLYYYGTPLMVTIGPLVLGYVHFLAKPKAYLKRIYLIHFIPALLIIGVTIFNYHLLSNTEKLEYISYFRETLKNTRLDKSLPEKLTNTIFRIYFIAYLIASWIYLNRVKNLIRSKVNEGFIKFLLLGLFIISILSIILEASILASDYVYRFAAFLIIFSSHIFGLTYIFFRPPKSLTKADKYNKSGLKEEDAHALEMKLENILIQDKIYKDPLLTIHKLALRVETNPHYLSQLINSEYKKTYSDLINSYRIDEAKKLLTDKGHIYSIEKIAEESGFASPSSFFRVFKKNTGLTPTEYKKQNKKT